MKKIFAMTIAIFIFFSFAVTAAAIGLCPHCGMKYANEDAINCPQCKTPIDQKVVETSVEEASSNSNVLCPAIILVIVLAGIIGAYVVFAMYLPKPQEEQSHKL